MSEFTYDRDYNCPFFVHIEWKTGYLDINMTALAFSSAFRHCYNKVLKICTNPEDVYNKLHPFMSEYISTASKWLPSFQSEYDSAMNLYNAKIEDTRQNYRKGSRMYNNSLKCANCYLGIAKEKKQFITMFQRFLKYGPANLSLLEKII